MSGKFSNGVLVTLLSVFLLGFVVGCGGPSRVAAPKWDPEGIADACMKQCDTDNDGYISKKELDNAPGLKFASQQLDTDSDDKLSRDEVLVRFTDLVESKTGYQGFLCYVLYNKQPLVDGKVRLVPEPFLEGFIQPAEGEVSDAQTGAAQLSTQNEEGIFGVRSGMYRVEITSDSVKVGKKYNEETTLGVEVAPFTNPFLPAGGIKFNVGR